jgi:nicotinamidase-related amidase
MRVDEIDPAKTAMIVVDMQNDFVAAGAPMETPAARAMVPKLAEALKICRDTGIRVIYTAHVHRRDGCDMGLFDDMHPPIANRDALVDGTQGVDIYPELAPAPGEHVIKKHRYSGFFGTDLDIILREWGVDTVIVSGRRQRIAVMRQRATQCSAITGWSSSRMRRRPTTIPIAASEPCRMARFITQPSSYSPPRPRM